MCACVSLLITVNGTNGADTPYDENSNNNNNSNDGGGNGGDDAVLVVVPIHKEQ